MNPDSAPCLPHHLVLPTLLSDHPSGFWVARADVTHTGARHVSRHIKRLSKARRVPPRHRRAGSLEGREPAFDGCHRSAPRTTRLKSVTDSARAESNICSLRKRDRLAFLKVSMSRRRAAGWRQSSPRSTSNGSKGVRRSCSPEPSNARSLTIRPVNIVHFPGRRRPHRRARRLRPPRIRSGGDRRRPDAHQKRSRQGDGLRQRHRQALSEAAECPRVRNRRSGQSPNDDSVCRTRRR
jgi:hypothetical protein